MANPLAIAAALVTAAALLTACSEDPDDCTAPSAALLALPERAGGSSGGRGGSIGGSRGSAPKHRPHGSTGGVHHFPKRVDVDIDSACDD